MGDEVIADSGKAAGHAIHLIRENPGIDRHLVESEIRDLMPGGYDRGDMDAVLDYAESVA